jgi:hypothetical protein
MNGVQAQVSCDVYLPSIKGTYEGDCSNGKAYGKGKSVGTDSYEGEFINGYPEGKGMYVWKDGHYFIGQFKKGTMEGAGDMYFESANGQDSIITGFWKKGKYFGPFEVSYILVSSTSRINKVDCRLSKKGGNGIINITSSQQLSFGTELPSINNITVMAGTYLNKAQSVLSNSTITRLQQLTFPFRAIFYYTNGEYFEMTFNEAGDYDVNVNLL